MAKSDDSKRVKFPASSKGGRAVYAKYGQIGDPEIRKKKWREWWNAKGKFQAHPILGHQKKIRIPSRSPKLAEFVGIMMGDGGITHRQICITLNGEDDAEYVLFVDGLICDLFGVTPSIHKRRDQKAVDIKIFRTKLVRFSRSIGLKVGNKLKQNLDVPRWIMRDRSFQEACLRGLFDTDGCTVIHRYKSKGKIYIYKKWHFSSASPSLLDSVAEILQAFDFKPRIDHNGRRVWLDAQADVARYFKVIGTSNPKHQRRFSGEVAEWLKAASC